MEKDIESIIKKAQTPTQKTPKPKKTAAEPKNQETHCEHDILKKFQQEQEEYVASKQCQKKIIAGNVFNRLVSNKKKMSTE